nr:hypothetical protein [Methylobacterium sp. Leaf118]
MILQRALHHLAPRRLCRREVRVGVAHGALQGIDDQAGIGDPHVADPDERHLPRRPTSGTGSEAITSGMSNSRGSAPRFAPKGERFETNGAIALSPRVIVCRLKTVRPYAGSALNRTRLAGDAPALIDSPYRQPAAQSPRREAIAILRSIFIMEYQFLE